MILGNYSVLNKNPSRSTGGLSFKGSLAPYDSQYNFYVSDADNGQLKYASSPTATQPPYSYVLAPKGGELSATTTLKGSGIVAGSMIMGKSCTANMSGVGGISGLLGLLTSLSANMSGVGGLSGGLGLSLALFASMSGSGSLSGSLSMSVPFIANMSGSGNLVGNLKGNASLSATIYVNSGSATIKELVDGVWNAIATEYNTGGTMGEAVQTGGGGGGGGGSGATPAQIWSYANRTLTESAGLTTEEHNKLFSLENSTGGGGFINYQAINSHTTEKVNELKKAIESKPDYTEKLNEIDSHIELAKEETIDTIKEAETEVCSDIIRKTKEIKEDNITTRNLVRQKTKKIDENVSKLADRQDKTDKMIESEADQIEKLIEQNIDFEADEIEKQIQEQIDKEIEEIESNQSNDGNNNGTEGEVQRTPN